jgi:hypothetical protein
MFNRGVIMSFKNQINTMKNNWFLILISLFLVILVVLGLGFFSKGYNDFDGIDMSFRNNSESLGSAAEKSYVNTYSPEVDSRKITVYTNLNLKLKKNQFSKVDLNLKNIVINTNSILLKENTSVYNRNNNLKSGNYTIKVESVKLDSIISQLKNLGEVNSFSSHKTDITEQYENLEIELNSENNKLKRFKELYDSNSALLENKVELIEKIFNQERRIKYLEESLENKDKTVKYSTINLSVSEYSNYISIIFVKFSDLLKTIVGSINVLLHIIFAVVPFIIFIWLIVMVVKLFKKKRKIKK